MRIKRIEINENFQDHGVLAGDVRELTAKLQAEANTADDLKLRLTKAETEAAKEQQEKFKVYDELHAAEDERRDWQRKYETFKDEATDKISKLE